MNQRPSMTDQAAPASLIPTNGWHCTHYYYSFDRSILANLTADQVVAGAGELAKVLDPGSENASSRLQTSIVSGHKADFSLMLMDPDPLVIDRVHQSVLACALGPAIVPTYSFVSLSEISEYVPSVEQYSNRIIREGESQGSPSYNAKMKAYEARLPVMNRQRLTPDFPEWPATCFYPMNKKRNVGENWFMEPFSKRNELMAEHARSGIKFMGKVSQLITVGCGLEDWEWGVTLWARNPEFLMEIVYKMRFDEASAKYAEFGPFYTSYVCSPEAMLEHCHIG
ncbi:heme-dependent peroxidase [Pirellulaceae bacterium]|jgi:hydrogen peroxide-dependent heme synthase|nr:heme-dependent peroxidase [Pirellulaceae bacterium]